jgi:hypothetical protein
MLRLMKVSFLAFVAFVGFTPRTVRAERQCRQHCGVIAIGQPKLLPLSDAQYLIGNMRQQLKSLSVQLPNDANVRPGSIDPNAINLRQIDTLIQALSIKAQYNQGDVINTRVAQQKYQQDLAIYQQNLAKKQQYDDQINQLKLNEGPVQARVTNLTAQQASVNASITTITASLTSATADLTTAQNATSPNAAQIAVLQNRVNNLRRQLDSLNNQLNQVSTELSRAKIEKDSIDSEITQLTAQQTALGTLAAPTLTVTPTDVPGDQPAAGALVELLGSEDVKKALAANMVNILKNDPQSPYVLQLNNLIDGYLQTVARRLTTLRQSIDPNYELYFMEASASPTPSNRAKNHLARARWKITDWEIDWTALTREYISEESFEKLVREVSSKKAAYQKDLPQIDILLELENLKNAEIDLEIPLRALLKSRAPDEKLATSRDSALNRINDQVSRLSGKLLELGCKNRQSEERTLIEGAESICLRATGSSERVYRYLLAMGLIAAEGGMRARQAVSLGASPFVFELSPQQAAVNVARSEARESRFSVTGIFKTLVGFGGSAGYGRQHDAVSQFLDREIYQAASGKGLHEFGWDYGPLPGDDFAGQGSYSSYGVVAVPTFVSSITFDVSGDWLLQPAKGAVSGIVGTAGPADLPEIGPFSVYLSGAKDLWIDGLDYPTVSAGEQQSVILHGKGFSEETSILINNIPLEPRWRLIDKSTGDVSYTPSSSTIEDGTENTGGSGRAFGSFEVLSSQTITMRFRLQPDFVGNPQITLISPNRSVQLNNLPLTINGRARERLEWLQDDFRRGLSKESIMFEPRDAWRGLSSTPEILHADETANLADIRIRVRGMSPAKFEARVDAKSRFKDVTNQKYKEPDSDGFVFYDLPITSGDIMLRFLDANGAMIFETRIPIPLRPKINTITPASGDATGGDTVTIAGANFAHASKVLFGNAEAKIVSRSESSLRVSAPKGDAGSSVVVQVVSDVLADAKDVTSIETDKKYAYQDASKPPNLLQAPVAWLGLGPPASPAVGVTFKFKLPDGATAPAFYANDGSGWTRLASVTSRPGDLWDLSKARVVRGRLSIRLSATVGGQEKVLDEEDFIVPFRPQLDKQKVSGRPGDVVTITGKYLEDVDAIDIGEARGLKPKLALYDQLTVKIPAKDVAKPSAEGVAPIHVKLVSGESSTQEATLTYSNEPASSPKVSLPGGSGADRNAKVSR